MFSSKTGEPEWSVSQPKQGQSEKVDGYAQDLGWLYQRAYPQADQGSSEAEEMGQKVLEEAKLNTDRPTNRDTLPMSIRHGNTSCKCFICGQVGHL